MVDEGDAQLGWGEAPPLSHRKTHGHWMVRSLELGVQDVVCAPALKGQDVLQLVLAGGMVVAGNLWP